MEGHGLEVRNEAWKPLPKLALSRETSALLLIDMQQAFTPDRVRAEAERRRRAGIIEDARYYGERWPAVVDRVRSLQARCRQVGIEVLFLRVQSMTADGRDRGKGHKNLGIHYPPGSPEAEILAELSPARDEIVLSKTAASGFTGTGLHYVLTNIGISTLIVVGVMTSACVESTVRDAVDLGYGVLLVQDGCCTWSSQLQDATVRVLGASFCRIVTAEEMLSQLDNL
jgi:nicotinamidase-related amidase